MKKIILLTAFLWLLAGCKTGPADSLTALFPETETPTSATLCIGPDAIREPVLLLSTDSLLICTNHMTPKAIRVYDLNSGQWNDIVSLGRAENELLDASSIWLSGNALHIYGANSGKILHIPLDQLFVPNPTMTITSFSRGYYNLSFCARNSCYAGPTGMAGDSSVAPFSLLGGDSSKISSFGTYRDSDSEADRNELRFAYQGVLNMNSDGTRIAYASFFGSVFQFFDSSDPRNIRLVREYRFAEPAYLPASDPGQQSYFVRWEKDCRKGALATAFNKEGFFVLCEEGKLVSDKDWRMSTVYFFDWDGNPRKKLNLGRRVQTIACNEISNQLIALTVDEQEQYAFVAYDL